MEVISLKLEENLLNEIDRKLSRHRYSTRTEFIRDAIRQKLSELEKEEILRHLHSLKGISKRRTTDEQLHAAGERVFDKIERRLKLK